MKIVHISAECYPVAKVGGLGDVVGALPKYQKNIGEEVKVILPCYQTKFVQENEFNCVHSGILKLGDLVFSFEVLKEVTEKLGYELYLISIPGLLDREQVYGYPDDTERFLSFQIAILDWLLSRNIEVDLIHCHDHHTGLIPFMLSHAYKYERLSKIPTVITIHSCIYQGQFGFDKMNYLPEFDITKAGLLDWNSSINPLATAIKCASRVTTVSPTYLNEINESANGLEQLFQMYREKSIGILNGIDNELWNPKTDSMLIENYSIEDFIIGKKKNKEKLCEQFNLDPSKPLFCFIGRLLVEKGADLLPHAIATSLSENPKEMNFLILGSGNTEIENQLNHLKDSYQGNYNTIIGYNEALSHLIYAGADFLLMPSRIEPCGLNQMYAMRYGSIPIVRRTGGLKDTVTDFGDNGNGICHDQASVDDVCYSIQRGIELFNDNEKTEAIRKLGMQIDHSWESVCKEYIEVYNLILE